MKTRVLRCWHEPTASFVFRAQVWRIIQPKQERFREPYYGASAAHLERIKQWNETITDLFGFVTVRNFIMQDEAETYAARLVDGLENQEPHKVVAEFGA